MPDKPSRNEDEYFAKREAEILKARREASDRAARDAERRSHFMRCPKCGATLIAEVRSGVQIDRCPECLGIWFDAGEAEQLIKMEGRSGVGGLFAALARGMRSSSSSPQHEPHQG